jgi:hypothetical protein
MATLPPAEAAVIMTHRPGPDEYASSLAGYVGQIDEDEDILWLLGSQLDQALGRLENAGPRGDYRYAPDKWSIKEIVGHLCDTERVFTYRALRVSRGDTTPLPSFDDQAYVAAGGAGNRTLADLVAEWGDVRRATLSFFRNLPAEAWHRQGTASDQPISVRALAYVIAGHVRHHLRVLEERYTE